MNPSSALQQLQMMTAWFDPDVLRRFVEMLGMYPSGSVVKLRSGLLALVFDQDRKAPDLPLVRTFWDTATGGPIRGRNIVLSSSAGEERIDFAVEPEDFGIADFASLREKIFKQATKEQGE